MAERPFTQHDLEQAYAEGVADAERELLPFHGVDAVPFPRDRPHFPATVVYEQALLEYLHRVLWLLEDARITEEQAREDAFADPQHERKRVAAASGSNRVSTALRRTVIRAQISGDRQRAKEHLDECSETRRRRAWLVARLTEELEQVRSWLDEQVDEAAAYAKSRVGRRRGNDLPGTAAPYSMRAFLAEDPARALRPGGSEPGGVDYGHTWTWERSGRPWEVTRWAVSWLDNGEICARDVTHGPHAGQSRLGDHAVLLLGRVPRPGRLSDDFLAELQTSIQPEERNTLVAVAQAVADRQRSLAHQP